MNLLRYMVTTLVDRVELRYADKLVARAREHPILAEEMLLRMQLLQIHRFMWKVMLDKHFNRLTTWIEGVLR